MPKPDPKTRGAKPARRSPRRDYLLGEVGRALLEPGTVTDATFSVVDALIAKWRTGKGRHYDPAVRGKLRIEKVGDVEAEFLKGYLLAFASSTTCASRFSQAIGCLAKFNDPRLVPMFQGWLNEHLRKAMAHSLATERLVTALEGCGESVRNCQWDTTRSNEGFDGARAYLSEKIGVIL